MYKQKDIQKVIQALFPDIHSQNNSKRVSVACPFHLDGTKSGSIDTISGSFKCFANCFKINEGILRFDQLVDKALSLKDIDTQALKDLIITQHGIQVDRVYKSMPWDEIPQQIKDLWTMEYGFDLRVCKDLELTYTPTRSNLVFEIPVYNYAHSSVYVGSKFYYHSGNVKSNSTKGLGNGNIIPAKKRHIEQEIIITAGEKDMLAGRSYGFNTYTITGGEQARLKDNTIFFKKDVVIIYDNDETGKFGAKKLAKDLFYSKFPPDSIKILEKHYSFLEEKEDLWDLLCGSKSIDANSLRKMIDDTQYCNDSFFNEDIYSNYRNVSLSDASSNSMSNRLCLSNIEISWTNTDKYRVPYRWEFDIIRIPKIDEKTPYEKAALYTRLNNMTNDDSGTIKVEIKDYSKLISFFKKKNSTEKAICHFITGFTVTEVKDYIKLRLTKSDYITAQRFSIEDCTKIYNHADDFQTNTSMEAFYFGDEDINGNEKYTILHSTTSHTNNDSKIVSIIKKFLPYKDGVAGFKPLTKEEGMQLLAFRKETPESIFKIFRNRIGVHLHPRLFWGTLLAYMSPLKINVAGNVMRGAIHTILIGETRIGKTELFQHMTELFQVSRWVSAKGSTSMAIVGGSNRMANGTMAIRTGVIGKCNKGLLIIDEIHGNTDIIRTLTTVKSSNELKITRVSGEVSQEAYLRLIEIANPLPPGRSTADLAIAHFNHGLQVLHSTVGSPEDIARAEYSIIVGKTKEVVSKTPPFNKYDSSLWRRLIRWVWSRTSDDVKVNYDIRIYAAEQSIALNELYPVDEQIIGREGWKKILRIAGAFAALSFSTPDFKSLVITKVHIDHAVRFLKDIYDNSDFRIMKAVAQKATYDKPTNKNIATLKNLFTLASSRDERLEEMYSMCDALMDGGQISKSDITDHFELRMHQEKVFQKLKVDKFIQPLARDFFRISAKFAKVYSHLINKKLIPDRPGCDLDPWGVNKDD